ncbi:D-3-phosphoglycerate dehydrogenase [Nitzschia inconspicua]|uniref:D-3-phosphoglycerate dehydrogenase n=1 Tax=Nitzschia inconspicua TaxID=303405 RepID=A0A9K3LYW7_9STRA|nr:D-3-phosphoglycerate dehydrogenase [Nitzschia inconspicua]
MLSKTCATVAFRFSSQRTAFVAASSSFGKFGSGGGLCRFASAAAAPMDNNNNATTTVSPESLLEHFQTTTKSSNNSMIGNNVGDAMYALYKADAVCFDVDSTVIAEEGIDVLADYLGKGEQVAALTKQAMEGGMKFQDALQQRLELLQPSQQSILQLLQEQPLQLTPNIDTLMNALQSKQVDIWLVSGGFRIMIEPVASLLNISKHNIVANTILFDEVGNYNGFDKTEPTSADMGKPKALQQIQTQHNYRCMVMVGDGATDAQAKPPAQAFIGFGGVIERQAVKEKADWFVTDFMDMVHIIEQR